jgi:hypothetical protein
MHSFMLYDFILLMYIMNSLKIRYQKQAHIHKHKRHLTIPRVCDTLDAQTIQHIGQNIAEIQNKVDPTFLHVYLNSVCRSFGDPASIKACFKSLIIPPFEEQMKIMDNLRKLNATVDISEIQGPLMSLFVQHEFEKAKELLAHYIEYRTEFEQIKELVADSLPLISGGRNIIEL